MIIDIHTHIFPEKIAAGAVDHLKGKAHVTAWSEATASGLAADMKKAGIDRSVVIPVATSARQVIRINDTAVRQNESFSETGICSFGGIHPDFEDYREELARIQKLGVKGIKLHPIYQGIDIDDIRFLRIIDRAAELGLIVITHSGYDVGFPGVAHCSPQMCRHVTQEIGSFPFILAHMGGWRCWDDVPDFLAGTGVYLDTSFSAGKLNPLPDGYWKEEDLPMLDESQFMTLIRAFGTDHILFGTDSPWSDPVQELAFLRGLPLTDAELEQILGGNAARLLGWA